MPTLRQVEYLLAVAATGSLRRAAERLDVSQPTLSVQLANLERDLGVTLLERRRTATTLTPAGRELLPVAQRVLGQWHEFEELAHALGDDSSSTHRLGVPPTLGPYLLPTIVPLIHRRYPRLKLYVREEVPRELESGLLEGRHDVVLGPLSLKNPAVTTEMLFREPLHLVASPETQIDDSRPFNEQDLSGLEILGLDARHNLHREVQQICERTGARMNRDYEGTSLDTLRQMVVMGMGVAFLPGLYIRSEVHRPEELRIIPVHGVGLYREHALAYRATSPCRHLYRALAALIRDSLVDHLAGAVSAIHGRGSSQAPLPAPLRSCETHGDSGA